MRTEMNPSIEELGQVKKMSQTVRQIEGKDRKIGGPVQKV